MCTASRHLCKHRYIRPCVCVCSVTKLCLTPLNPMDCSPLGSSMHGISQAKILEQVAISFSRGTSWSRDQTCISCISRRVLYCWATREDHLYMHIYVIYLCIYQYVYIHIHTYVSLYIFAEYILYIYKCYIYIQQMLTYIYMNPWLWKE